MSELHQPPPSKFDPDDLIRQEAMKSTAAMLEMEKELDNTFRVDIGNFVRTGLPILHGILMDTIPRNTWLVWCEKMNREVHVCNEQGDVVYKIPKLFIDGTINREDIHNGGSSFNNRAEGARLLAGQDKRRYEIELTAAISDAYTPNRSDISLLDKFNEMFTKYGYAKIEIRTADGDTLTSASEPVKVEDNNYDINEGEEL